MKACRMGILAVYSGMVTKKLQSLAKYQRIVASLEKQLAETQRKLRGLPAKHGCRTMNEFIAALRAANDGKAGFITKAGRPRAPRTKITPEMKQKLKTLTQAGKTGAEIAKQIGISLPSVHNIKKELGLVKKRS